MAIAGGGSIEARLRRLGVVREATATSTATATATSTATTVLLKRKKEDDHGTTSQPVAFSGTWSKDGPLKAKKTLGKTKPASRQSTGTSTPRTSTPLPSPPPPSPPPPSPPPASLSRPRRQLALVGPATSGSTRHTDASTVVLDLRPTYSAAFHDESLDDDPPVTLVYPTGAQESFLLWTPKRSNEYRPLDELVRTIAVVVDHLVPPTHRSRFRGDVAANGGRPPLLRRLERAKNIKDGAAFRAALVEYNDEIRRLAMDGVFRKATAEMTVLPLELSRLIQLQVHNRIVGPQAERLNRYTAWTDNVYGELTPTFMEKVFRQVDRVLAKELASATSPATELPPPGLFLDMGCGTGNCVVQAVLERGSAGVGIEVMACPAELGARQRDELDARTRNLFGIELPSLELVHGDFLEAWRAPCTRWLSEAEVILINNYAFSPETNERIKTLLYDVSPGAFIVSLRPFFHARAAAAAAGTLDAVFTSERYEYASGDVSWTDQGGVYYMARRRRSE